MNVKRTDSNNSHERSPTTSLRIPKTLNLQLDVEAREQHLTKSEVIVRHVLSDMKKAKELKDMDVFDDLTGEDLVYNCLVVFGINRDELRQSPEKQEQFCKTIYPVMCNILNYGTTYKSVNEPLQNVLSPDYICKASIADNLYRYLLQYTTNEYQRELGVLQALREQYINAL